MKDRLFFVFLIITGNAHLSVLHFYKDAYNIEWTEIHDIILV